MTKIYYYVSPSKTEAVSKFIESLEKAEKGKLFHIFEHIKKHGIITAIPHAKKLVGTKLWEIKLISKTSIRVIYAIVFRKDILILLGFTKKTQKTPKKYIKTAIARLQEWKTRFDA